MVTSFFTRIYQLLVVAKRLNVDLLTSTLRTGNLSIILSLIISQRAVVTHPSKGFDSPQLSDIQLYPVSRQRTLSADSGKLEQREER